MTTAEEGAAWAVRAGALLGVDFWLGSGGHAVKISLVL